MIAWLSDWLRDIIAVIMLATFVELLLPNKSMQRYARLVIGLLILLTIMSPILRLLQGDFNAKLKDGISNWDQLEAQHEVKMPTLNDIQKKAEDLNKQQNSDAAALMEQTLENSMVDAVVKQTGLSVEAVDVTLKWEQQGKTMTPYVSAVLVTLPTDKADSASSEESSDAVKEVASVSVDVDVDVNIDRSQDDKQAAGDAAQEKPDDGFTKVNPSDSEEIRDVLAEGWSVNPSRIQVRQRAESSVH
ncbi:stage III sporulation protein AF [Paenibacillus sp. YAF4_2]|uniref:stage III sporulation protein AF n=1 Tax=Paenibacillus sp. YAF4_2 TaxID=3233085 RepID=UPI003F9B0DE3